MMHKFGVALGCLAFLALNACQLRKPPQTSSVKEAPDASNNPESLGIKGPFKWDELKDKTSGGIEHPWSDSYWPLTQKAMANRWRLKDAPSNKVPLSPQPGTLHQQVNEAIKAYTEKSPQINFLSPGEKYDLLVSGGKLPAETLKKLAAQHQAYEKRSPDINALEKKLEQLVADEKKIVEEIMVIAKTRRAMTVEKEKAEREGDKVKLSKIEKDLEENFKQAEAAGDRRRVVSRQLDPLKSEIKAVMKDIHSGSQELAAELKKHWPMTGQGWEDWAYYYTSYDGNWGWMGLCHGWAPASLVVAKPKHAVLVEKEGREILFTEGDIRGLMTKLWADQAPPNEFFGARRCESQSFTKDRRGRIVDGTICYDKQSGSCTEKENGQIIHVKSNRIEDGLVLFTESIYSDEVKVARVAEELGGDHYAMRIFSSTDDLEQWQGSEGKTNNFKTAVMHLTAGCRDTTPMTYHVALTKLLKGGTGFVMDATRTDQVWNQPVYRYELEYLPLVLNKKDPTGKTLSKPGELVAVADIKDPYRTYRAKGTAYLVQVKAKVYFGLENGPFDLWDGTGKDKNREAVNTYTLEFNENKELIGGEWGLVPLPGKADSIDKKKVELISGDAPDFIWYYPRGSKAARGTLESELLTKIHQCSVEGPTENYKTLARSGEGAPKESGIKVRRCKL